MITSTNEIISKKCTCCENLLNLDSFYSKGNRIDSQCKQCILKKKKSKYITKQEEIDFDSLLKIFKLIQELELTEIDFAISLLDKATSLCQTKTQQ